MKRFAAVTCVSVVAVAAAAIAQPPGGSVPKEAQVHLDRARTLAGASYMKTTYSLQCGLSGPARSNFGKAPPPEPARLFDNLYYVGLKSVGAYALTTPAGIILLDSLNTADDARDVIEPGLRKLGLDPAQVKYVVITHGHGDHYGGATYFAEKYGAHVMMSAADWELVAKPRQPVPGRELPPFSPPPSKDMVATDGMVLKLGDQTVRIALTPGHTPGTISFVIPVTDKGKRHVLAMWGGTGVPGDPAARAQYIASAAKFAALSKAAGADVELSNHPFVDDSLTRMEQERAAPDKPNPFVIGRAAYDRYAAIIGECAKAVAAGGPTAS